MSWRTLVVLVLWPIGLGAQVSGDRLLQAAREPHNWLTYNGTYDSQRHSPLDQITPANVKDLELEWVFQARSLEKFIGHAARRRWGHVCDAGAERRRGARRQHRPRVLGLSLHAGAGFEAVLRCREPRRGHPWRHPVHRDHRRLPDCARRADGAAELENRGGRLQRRVLVDACRRWSSRTRSSSARPAASTGSAASSPPTTSRPARNGGASIPFPARANPAMRPGRMTTGRPAAVDLGHRLLRSGAQSDLLGNRESVARLESRRSVPATTSTPTRSSRSTPDTGELRVAFPVHAA